VCARACVWIAQGGSERVVLGVSHDAGKIHVAPASATAGGSIAQVLFSHSLFTPLSSSSLTYIHVYQSIDSSNSPPPPPLALPSCIFLTGTHAHIDVKVHFLRLSLSLALSRSLVFSLFLSRSLSFCLISLLPSLALSFSVAVKTQSGMQVAHTDFKAHTCTLGCKDAECHLVLVCHETQRVTVTHASAIHRRKGTHTHVQNIEGGSKDAACRLVLPRHHSCVTV